MIQPQSPAPVLKVNHYRKSYGSKLVVPDLSLEVAPGDVFGYIGHNGSGKTTLIRSVVGAQPMDAGTIEICGFDITRQPVECKRRMAYVPDNPDVYDFMTGIQYLNYIADMFGVDSSTRNQRIADYAERLGLRTALGDMASSYSHGMKQKLVLIGAFLHDPTLLVLDEPFVGLDPLASHELKLMMAETASRGGAVFFSSHVLEVVEKLCNKVAILRAGELLACGDTDEVRGDESLEEVFLGLIDNGASSANPQAQQPAQAQQFPQGGMPNQAGGHAGGHARIASHDDANSSRKGVFGGKRRR